MNDLVEFLRVRLDGDERTAARAAAMTVDWEDPLSVIEGGELTLLAINPARVLGEIEAKRNIIAEYERIEKSLAAYANQGNAGAFMAMQTVIKLLTEAYSDHPDYREEWRP